MERGPDWSDDDVALMLALAEVRQEEALAPGIDWSPSGRPMDEATSKWADPARRRQGWHYETRVRVDHAQRTLNEAKRTRAEAFPDEDADSLVWSLVRVEDGPIDPNE